MKHDFKAPIEKTSTELARILIEKMHENKDWLVFENKNEETEEEKKERNEKFADFVAEYLKVASMTDIPADYTTWSLEKVIGALSVMKNNIEGMIRTHEDEILSRLYREKSPESGKYRKDVAKLGTVLLTLENMREETGGNVEDYINK
jgi:hypothetical protein